MKIYLKSALSFILAFAIAAVVSCGGSSKDESGALNPPSADLTGDWTFNKTTNGNCSGETYPQTSTETVNITQTGNNLTIATSTSSAISGTISGLNVNIRGTYFDSEGNTSVSISGTSASDGNSINMTGSWTWKSNSSSYTCSGTVNLIGTKSGVPVVPADVNGTWNGIWQSSYGGGISGSFTAVVAQSGTVLSGTIDVPYIGMSGATLKGTINGTNMTFGDVGNTITFTGIVSGNAASGSFVYPSMSISGTWTASKGTVIPFYSDITLNTTYNETIESFGTKVYRIQTLDSGNYLISLTNLSSDLGWILCSCDPMDSSVNDLADNIIDSTNGNLFNDTTNEVYTESLSASTYYYIVVDEYDSVSSSYGLEVSH
jgi:hypothetical protein